MMKRFLFITLFSSLIIYGHGNKCNNRNNHNNDSIYVKEMRLPNEYRVIMENLIIPYLTKNNLDKEKYVVNLDTWYEYPNGIAVRLDDRVFDSALYYQYYDSILMISSSEDFGKYIVPRKEKAFKKTSPFFGFSDLPLWGLVETEDGWIIRLSLFADDN